MQFTTSMQSYLMSHHLDKYVYTSGKDSKDQRKIESFVNKNRYSPECTKEKTRPII